MNYVPYHMHTHMSNPTTNIDSVTKLNQYVARAVECGMTALGISEHGNVFNWTARKKEIEAAGLKYIHAVETYVTERLDPKEKVRDNRHCVLIARDWEGCKEINTMISRAYNRQDGHFYYVPRISLDELCGTSDHVIVTSACIAGLLGDNATNEMRRRVLEFFADNRSRCFLEVQHHNTDDQCAHNIGMSAYNIRYGVPLIAGTDTHSLDAQHADARLMMQKAKGATFDGEDGWDLTWKTYDELCDAFRKQNSLEESAWMEAIDNTNRMADMVETYALDDSPKYPELFENADEEFGRACYEAIDLHPYALKRHTREELVARVEEELPVYRTTKTQSFMLFEKLMMDWCHENGIYAGYGRGSVNGSMIAYLLGITDIDAMRFDLNFFRFMNPDRVSLADIDTDLFSSDRAKLQDFLLNHDRLRTAQIITFQTVALKGAIRDIGRALEMPLPEVDAIANGVDADEESLRQKYPKLFHYVDLVQGTIVSQGIHASGILCSTDNIEELCGTCSSKDTPYLVTALDMKALDLVGMSKFDLLGLDNVGLINETCKLAGIDRITPDNIDLDDPAVWEDIRKDTSMIFQWESPFASQIARSLLSKDVFESAKEHLPSVTMLDLFAFGNGMLRPGGASFRDKASKGIFHDNGLPELNNLLAGEMGYLTYQESIMRFLVQFCGYNGSESDSVRRAVAKKKNTEQLIPEIRERFIAYSSEHYGKTKEECETIVEPFLQAILDCSAYAFSKNHSIPYSLIGYACGWLRHYYPVEFLTTCLNVYAGDEEETAIVTEYCGKHGIRILPIRFGKSRSGYFMDKESNAIYKGLTSVKYISAELGEELYTIARREKPSTFTDLLFKLNDTTIDSRQLNILIDLGYFADYGNANELETLQYVFENMLKSGEAKSIKRERVPESSDLYNAIAAHSDGKKKDGTDAASWKIRDCMAVMADMEKAVLARHMPDFDTRLKMKWQREYLGHISATGRDEDRSLLVVTDKFPLRRKADGRLFGYSVVTTSVGSGKSSRFTVFCNVWNRCGELKKDDLIRCLGYERDGQYFRMTNYRLEGEVA